MSWRRLRKVAQNRIADLIFFASIASLVLSPHAINAVLSWMRPTISAASGKAEASGASRFTTTAWEPKP